MERRVVVVEHRPWLRVVTIAAAVAVGVALFVAGYMGGVWRMSDKQSALRGLADEHAEATARVVELERKLADLKLSQVVDGEANEQLRLDLKEQHDQLASLEEEVRFYRSLMAPSEAERGLRIEKLDLTRNGRRSVDYRLLLTQIVVRRGWVSGNVNVDVVGERGGVQQVLPLTELTALDAYPLKFRFRYFQDFSGKIELPDDFTPRRVVVTAETGGRDGKRLQRSFDWSVQEG